MTLLALFERHLVWSRPNPGGGVSYYYYYDEVTWAAGALALLWLAWLLTSRYRRRRAQRRPPRRERRRALRRVVRRKRELSRRYLAPGFSANVHAVGVGRVGVGGDYCIQVFVADAGREPWPGAGALPAAYRGVPLRLVEMAPAGLLSNVSARRYAGGMRGREEVIVGGISGANTNLDGESGTIGYFCTPRRRFTRRAEVHLLSNSHVFADLRKARADDADLIVQPSPGEPEGGRPIGTLRHYAPLKFEEDGAGEPNHVDAAVARLWGPQAHKPVIPLIGAVCGHVEKKDVEVWEGVRKFGRTTGYTEGRVYSIYMDLWVRYDRTGRRAFFRDQILVEPAAEVCEKFVSKGDSGSLLVDAERRALGLVFAGTSEAPPPPPQGEPAPPPASPPQRVRGYGVANPISEVLDRLKIDLLV